jgi:Glycoside-hydrolase family GH114
MNSLVCPLWLICAVTVAGCGSVNDEFEPALSPSTEAAPQATEQAIAVTSPADQPPIALPDVGVGFDYQLGGSYEPASDVRVVGRDRTGPPSPDRYSICYVNGFQTQPDARSFWLDQHPDLLVRDQAGRPVIDPGWPDELILDASTGAKRQALADIVGAWIDGCATDGFDAVEIDNLDTFARFPEQLRADDAIDLAGRYADRAHAAGLAIAQKNTAELLDRIDRIGFDFAVVEECNRYDECEAFADAYDDRVFVIEYDQASFERGCRDHPELALVLRDLQLSKPGDPGYVRATCDP